MVVGALFFDYRSVSADCRRRLRFLETTLSPAQGGFKNLQKRSRRRQSAHFSSIIGVLAPTAVGGYDFLKPPRSEAKGVIHTSPGQSPGFMSPKSHQR